MNIPERAVDSARAGCAQGALVSDPREGKWGISSARKVRASAGPRKVLVKTLCKAPETLPGATYSPILFILTDNITVSRGGDEGDARDRRCTEKIIMAILIIV